MSICRGLRGVKTENVEKGLVLKEFLKGGGAKGCFGGSGWGSPGRDLERGKPLFLEER